MKKLGIIIDSFSGFTEAEVKEKGFHFLAMQIILDGKMYKEGIELVNFEESMRMIEKAKDKKTSQPNPADMEKLFKELSGQYEKIVYLCIGSKMSSTFSTASMLAKEYHGKIIIFDNSITGTNFIKAAEFLDQQVNNEGASLEKCLEKVSEWNKKSSTWIIPESIDAIRKGGRISKGTKFLLSKLSIIPMIVYKNATIEVQGVRRGFAKAVNTVIERVITSIGKDNIKDYCFELMHTAKEKTREMALKKLKELNINNIIVSIACAANGIQCGVGAISIIASPKKIV